MCHHEITEPELSSEVIDLINPNNGISTKGMRFFQVMKKETVMVKGCYQIPLLLKDINLNFPNNWKQALSGRLQNLQKKFAQEPKFFEDQKHSMEDMIKDVEESTAEYTEVTEVFSGMIRFQMRSNFNG